MDYGCGLGRATLWLARRFKRVLAIDVSEAHLGIAQKNLAARGITNVEFRLVRDIGDLSLLQGCQFFFSIIALQHNPPPLIVEMLSAIFSGLRPEGYAFFQVPTFAQGYTWSYKLHSAGQMSNQGMELHLVPQSEVFRLAVQSGCIPLEVQPDSLLGIPRWVSNTFLFSKPPSALAGND